MEEFEGADWVLVSDETAVDENRRDELLEALPGPLPRRRHRTRSTERRRRGTSDELEEDDQEVGRE